MNGKTSTFEHLLQANNEIKTAVNGRIFKNN